MLPLASTRLAPKAWKKLPQVSTESEVVPKPIPKGTPPLWQASAAFRKVSVVQASAFGAEPAGYIALMSMPACCLSRSILEQGPLIWAPTVAGIAIHLPSTLPRYSTVPLTAPCSLIRSAMMSSTGSSILAWSAGNQVDKARMSWPDLACASAAVVSNSLLPCEVM